DSNHFTAWLDLVKTAKLDVHYLVVKSNGNVLRELDLGKFDVVLLAAGGLLQVNEHDRNRLKKFLEKGGRLLVSGNAFFRGTVEKANELLVSHGLRMDDKEDANAANVEIKEADIVADPLTEGVKKLRFHRASPVVVTDKAKGKILVAAPIFPGD